MTSDDHVARNRAAWNISAAEYAEPGRRGWAGEPSWGIWNIPEGDVHVLPDVGGLDVIELGCGTAYVSAWLARRGARPVGIDMSENQLATARALRTSTICTSRSSRATPRRSRSRTPASISPSANTARRSGATHTGGFRKRPGSCVGAGV